MQQRLILFITFSLFLVSGIASAQDAIPFKQPLSKDLAQLIEQADSQQELVPILDRLSEDYYFSAQLSERALHNVADYLGLHLMDDFKAIPRFQQHNYLASVVNEFSHFSGKIIRKMRANKQQVDIVSGSITAHPCYAYLSGVIPYGHTQSWDYIVGISPSSKCNAVIAGDKLNQRFHGSVSLILHEVGHGIDRFLDNNDPDWDYSSTREFKKIQKHTPFNLDGFFYGKASYYKQHVTENFAELLAIYFQSRKSRERLARDYPAAYEYMRAHF